MPPFLRVTIGTVILALAAGVYAPLCATETDSIVTVLPPRLPAKRAVILTAEVDTSAPAAAVIFWIRMGHTVYRPRDARLDADGTWTTRLVWFGGSRAISYFVEVLDGDGDELALSGAAARPYHAYFSPESFMHRRQPSPLRWFWLGVLVLANLYVLRFLQRTDRLDRLRAFWSRLLRPLIPLRGDALIDALDSLLSRVPDRAVPGRGRLSPRLVLLRWLTSLRNARQHMREQRLKHRGIGPNHRRTPPAKRERKRPSDRRMAVRPWPALREAKIEHQHTGR